MDNENHKKTWNHFIQNLFCGELSFINFSFNGCILTVGFVMKIVSVSENHKYLKKGLPLLKRSQRSMFLWA